MHPAYLSLGGWVSLGSCAGLLALSLVAFARGPRGSFGLALGLLCLDVFVWSFSAFAGAASGAAEWGLLEATFACFTPPLALHVILAFVGRLRSFRVALAAAYLLFGALSISAAVGFVSPPTRSWPGSTAWAAVYLAGWVPLIALEVALLVKHLRASHAIAEQMRTRFALASTAVGALLGSSVMWDKALLGGRWLTPLFDAAPALRQLGALGSMGLVAAAALRFRLFGRELETGVALYSLAVAALGVLGYVSVFLWMGTSMSLLVVGVASLTVGLFGAIRGVVAGMNERRARLRELATLGRFSAQMAHDIQNPLAALKGAIELLQEELARGLSIDGRGRTLELAKEQTERLATIVEKYRRLSELQPVLAPVQVNALVERAVAAAEIETRASGRTLRTQAHFDPDLPDCPADGDLLASAVDNLVRNSLEAMPRGGTLVVRTESSRVNGRTCVRLAVEDDGDGMDARTAERAFDDFFTTKPHGGGFGLAFVRRVAEAHGGDVRLHSVLGRGTTVELLLPAHEPVGG
jgi:two-component system, NtrC family, sensor histidine kinase HydH